MLELLPPCIETIWDATNAVGPSYGFTEKRADIFLHLAVYTNYVNLGFNLGTQLHDPENRLKGTGTKIRHLRLLDLQELEDPYIQALINESIQIAPNRSESVLPQTIIRVMNGPKRRPGTGR